ncbi:MAG: type II toxin-antitoxin system VapC family toxin [Betaproteobacteria bacterium]|nr:type II toxin-antitoxin system VapC family toxin [Betaproteobacteria bacterium]
MKLLLDTCTFLWIIEGGAKLSSLARAAFSDPDNEVFLSVISAWEVAQKHAIGKLPLPQAPHKFVTRGREAHGITALALDENAALHVARLPHLHRDPFDRMLVCQAIEHGLAIVTPDAHITQYPVRTVW